MKFAFLIHSLRFDNIDDNQSIRWVSQNFPIDENLCSEKAGKENGQIRRGGGGGGGGGIRVLGLSSTSSSLSLTT